jgi:hypothetical protein
VEQPRLPTDIGRLQVRHLQVGKQRVDLSFLRLGERVVAFIEQQHGSQPVRLSVQL